MNIPETPSAEFIKKPTPDLRQQYSKEKIEAVPYVTIWEGSKLENECAFHEIHGNFTTDPRIESVRDALISFQTNGKTYHDSAKSRLVKVDAENDALGLTFQRVTYSDYVVTNMAMEVVPPGLNTTIREILEPGPELTDLPDSKCSNHLGVSCLVITKDNKLIMQKASSKKLTGAGQVTSSASGAMDWKDPNINPFEVMQSELYEELGLENAETANIQAIAIARELARGGKPEMFFILKSELESTEIMSRTGIDPEKEVERLFAINLPENTDDRVETLKSLWEDGQTSQSTKAALYYLSKAN